MTDEELSGWARNWHWNDTAEDKPVDPSIYFRDMRMLKAFVAAYEPQPALKIMPQAAAGTASREAFARRLANYDGNDFDAKPGIAEHDKEKYRKRADDILEFLANNEFRKWRRNQLIGSPTEEPANKGAEMGTVPDQLTDAQIEADIVQRLRDDTRNAVHCALSEEAADEIERLREASISELPDDIRVPLHELQADVDYMVGRMIDAGNSAPVITETIKAKLAALEAAIQSRAVPQEAPDTESDHGF